MNHHFIESFEDEREVLRKITELKAMGYAESDMYVIARSNEQLTMIRTRTAIDYHAAEGKGMSRLGVIFRSELIHPYLTNSEGNIRDAEEFYEYLLEGKLIFFYSNSSAVFAVERNHQNVKKEFLASKAVPVKVNPFLQRQPAAYLDEDEITIDKDHYDTCQPLETVTLRNSVEEKRE